MIRATCHAPLTVATAFAIKAGQDGDCAQLGLFDMRPLRLTRPAPDRAWCSVACWPFNKSRPPIQAADAGASRHD